MAFLVRKLGKMDEIFSLCDKSDIKKVYADIPTVEFRSKNGTLSTWRINSLEEIGNAVLAIAVTSSDISKMDFIIINTDPVSYTHLSGSRTILRSGAGVGRRSRTGYQPSCLIGKEPQSHQTGCPAGFQVFGSQSGLPEICLRFWRWH